MTQMFIYIFWYYVVPFGCNNWSKTANFGKDVTIPEKVTDRQTDFYLLILTLYTYYQCKLFVTQTLS